MHIKIGEDREQRGGPTVQRFGPISTTLYSLLIVVIEIMTQTVVFSLRHFNSTKQYPFSSTTLIAFTELIKFLFCFFAFCGQHRRLRFMPSPAFLIPAFFFVAASNVFFYCVKFVAPPTWNVLVQTRTVFSALGGYVIFGRPIGMRQWLAMVPLLLAACLAVWFCPGTEVASPMNHDENSNEPQSLWWMLVMLFGAACSAFSVGSSEFISRSGIRPIQEKHVQLHFFCAVLAMTWAELATRGNLVEINQRIFFPLDFYLVVLNLLVGALGGLTATYIIINRLSSPADNASRTVSSLVPPAIFLASTVTSSIVFPTQQSYPYVVSALILVLMCSTSLLCTVTPSPPSPEQDKVGSKLEV